jgi:hypothetical protein
MPSHRIRHTVLIALLGALPAIATAQGSQAGDNGRLPIGADSDSPRQAIPNSMSNDGNLYGYNGRVRYASPYAPTYYDAPYYVPRYYDGYHAEYYDVPPQYYVPPSYYYAPPSYYYPPPSYYPPRSYYYAPQYYGSTYYDSGVDYALLGCDREPLPLRAACRDDVVARYAR